MQLTKFQKLRLFLASGKNFSVADKTNRSFTREELRLNQLKLKKILSQIPFAAQTYDNQIKPVRNSVKHETLLPSQKTDSHPISVVFGIDCFSIRNKGKREKILVQTLDSFSFEAVKLFQNQFKEPIKEKPKSLQL